MPLANPADGVWFLEVGTAGKQLSEDKPRNYYLVCSHTDDAGEGAAMLFHHRQYGTPNDLAMRRKADEWFNECYQWTRARVKSGEDVLDWQGSPHPFTAAYSWQPGDSYSFLPAAFEKNEDTDKIIQRFLWNLCSVWEPWITWAKTHEIPVSPEVKHADFLDDPGWIVDEEPSGGQEGPQEAP